MRTSGRLRENKLGLVLGIIPKFPKDESISYLFKATRASVRLYVTDCKRPLASANLINYIPIFNFYTPADADNTMRTSGRLRENKLGLVRGEKKPGLVKAVFDSSCI
jgi:hypothetical protein